MSERNEAGPALDVAGILSTPVYGEALTVLNVAAAGPAADLATRVATEQAAAGWRSSVREPEDVATEEFEDVDVVVLWGLPAAESRAVVAGERPTVVVFEAADVRRVLTRPTRWLTELRQARNTNLLLLPVELAERYTRWGPPVPLAHRPVGLPGAAAVGVLSAWVTRAYAFGRRSGGA